MALIGFVTLFLLGVNYSAMAKIRTREECLSAIQAEGAWRKKEIITLRASVDAGGDAQSTLRRASVVMIYAHWEGFVKNSSNIYISFINDLIERRQTVFCEHFHQLMVWVSYRKKGDHPFLRNPVPLIDTLKFSSEIYELIPENLVDTEDNLKSKVLKKISNIIDIDYATFATKEKMIDAILLAKRNKIAHGERLQISHDEYVEIDQEIRTLISEYQEKIENNVQNEAYKKVYRYEG